MKILFLDVDGPLIPARMYYNNLKSAQYWDGTWKYDPVAVDMIKALLEKYPDLRLVYNSSHNNDGKAHMLSQALNNGFKSTDLHESDWITEFPLTTLRRMDAISKWLTEHSGVTKWAVFDDAKLDHPNAILINFNHGITLDDYQKAEKLLND